MEHIKICIKGRINRDWTDWLGGLKITHTTDGNTLLSGPIRDRSAIYGLLSQLSNLGLQLIFVMAEGVNNTGSGKEVQM